MMGRESPPQAKLFYTDFSLEARIRADHPLRKVAAAIDFDFVYAEVADCYGANGNVSVAPQGSISVGPPQRFDLLK